MPSLPRTSLLKLPTQRRSEETVHAILDATIRVLVDEGRTAFTTNRVAEVAGVGPGTLYQYFASGDMLLAGVVERGLLDAEELLRAAILSDVDVPIGELLRRAIDAILAVLEPHAVLLRELVASAPLLARHGITNVLEARLLDALRELIARDPTRYSLKTGPAVLFVGINGATFVCLKWLCERPPQVTREALVETMVAMVESVVEERPRPARPVGGMRAGPTGRGRRGTTPRERS